MIKCSNIIIRSNLYCLKNFDVSMPYFQLMDDFVNRFRAKFNNILSFIRTKRKFVNPYINNMDIDKNVLNLLHPAFLNEYTPRVTSPDGNCLWHMVSICLVGTQELTFFLRSATVYTLIRYKLFNYFII